MWLNVGSKKHNILVRETSLRRCIWRTKDVDLRKRVCEDKMGMYLNEKFLRMAGFYGAELPGDKAYRSELKSNVSDLCCVSIIREKCFLCV
jgi:hypothetical protein